MNVRQCFFTILIVLPALKVTMLPGYLSAEIGKDAWIAVALAMLIDLLMLACILVVNRKGGIAKVIERLFGKCVYVLVCGLIIVYMTVRVALCLQDPLHYMINMLFDHDEKIAIVLPLLFTAGYVGYKSARSVGRLVEVATLFLAVPALLSFTCSRAPVEIGYLTPVMEDGIGTLSGVTKVAVWFGDYLPLLFVRLDEKSEKKSPWLLLAGLAGTLITVAVFVAFISVYQGASPYIPDAFPKLARYNILGSEVGRLDMIAILFWLFSVVLTVSLVINAASRATSDMWKKSGKAPVVIATGIIFIILSVLVGGEESVYAMHSALLLPVVIFHLVVPVLAMFCALSKKGGKSEEARSK